MDECIHISNVDVNFIVSFPIVTNVYILQASFSDTFSITLQLYILFRMYILNSNTKSKRFYNDSNSKTFLLLFLLIKKMLSTHKLQTHDEDFLFSLYKKVYIKYRAHILFTSTRICIVHDK